MGKIEELRERRAKIYLGGGAKAIEKQHARGKLSARERIDALLDPGTFVELGTFVKHRCHVLGMENKETPGEGVVAGHGRINGRTVYIYSQDFTILGGAVGEMHAAKIIAVQELAMKTGCPLIGLIDSGGGRLHEGVNTASGYGKIFTRNAWASGSIPQISVILGPCAGGACYSPALTDFILTVDKISQMYLTGPVAVEQATGEKVDQETLGGAMTHSTTSGVAHFIDQTEADCFSRVRKLLDYLPQNYQEMAPEVTPTDDPNRVDESLNSIIPENNRLPYDVKDIITSLADNGEFLESMPLFADNIVTGFIRLNGISTGVVANQPMSMGGCLDVDASNKSARFIRTCDSFNIPLLTLVDVPGFLPGTDQEYKGIIRHGAKLLYAYSEATVPKVTVIMRKSYGGSYNAMCNKEAGADVVLAWPNAEIAVMGAAGAVNFVFKKEIAEAEDPVAMRAQKIKEYEDAYSNPYYAASFGYVDDVIEPKDTRARIIKEFKALEGKKEFRYPKKHSNIPL